MGFKYGSMCLFMSPAPTSFFSLREREAERFQLIMLGSVGHVHAHKWYFQECCLNLCSAFVSATYSRSLVSESIICLSERPIMPLPFVTATPRRSCGCGFLPLTGSCRSEIRPPDKHFGKLPSVASRYGPLKTRSRSISQRSEIP